MNIHFVTAFYLYSHNLWFSHLSISSFRGPICCSPNYKGSLDELKGLILLSQSEGDYRFHVLPRTALKSSDKFMDALSEVSPSRYVLLYASTDKEKAEAYHQYASQTLHLVGRKQVRWIMANPTVIDL